MKELPKEKYFYSNSEDPYEVRLKDITYSEETDPRKETVLLVVPPSPQEPTPGREFLITGPFEGFTYIATLIKKMGFNLKVVDCRLKDEAAYENEIVASASDSDIIGIATYCDSFVFLEKITLLLKEKYPAKTVFLGGPLITSLPELILSNTSADLAVLGEAELTLIELLETIFDKNGSSFAGIKGVAYKEGDSVVINSPRPQIKELDNLPFLDYSIWPNMKSIIENGQILISSMRGCPMECSFCFKTIPALRLKSLERFESEVSYLKEKTGFHYTWLNDLTFNVINERSEQVCRILKKHEVRYHCFARVRNINDEITAVLKETGCLGIWFGIESYDQDILDLNRKKISIEDINSAVASARRAGLAVRGLFIVGLPGETEESLKSMLDFIKEGDFLPLVKYLVPFPGTSVYNYAVEKCVIKDKLAFLRMLSTRVVRDFDDDITNITDLDDETLREYFHKIWEITKEREPAYEE